MEKKKSKKTWNRKLLKSVLETGKWKEKEDDAFAMFHKFLIEKGVQPGEVIILKEKTNYYRDNGYEYTTIDFLYWV